MNRKNGLILSSLIMIAVALTAGATPPVSSNQTFQFAVKSRMWIPLSYSDPGGSNLMFTLMSGPSHGIVEYASGTNRVAVPVGVPVSNYSWLYTSTETNAGADGFTWEVSDDTATSGVATVSVTLTTNTPPVSHDNFLSIVPGVARQSNLFAYTDPDSNQPFSFTLLSVPTNGLLEYRANDGGFLPATTNVPLTSIQYFYTPPTTPSSGDSFTWRMDDSIVTSAPAIVSILMSPNTPPVVSDQTISLPAGSVRLAIIQANSSWYDPDNGQVMSCELTEPPLAGILEYGSGTNYVAVPVHVPITNATWYYTTSITNTGSPYFFWNVSDGVSTSRTALMTVNLTTNTPPTVVNLTNTVAEGSINAPIWLQSSDPDFYQTKTYWVKTLPQRGTLAYYDPVSYAIVPVVTNSPASSVVYYTPTNLTPGAVDSVDWVMDDGMATSSVATLTLVGVANSPISVSDSSVSAVVGSVRKPIYLSSSHSDDYQPTAYRLRSAPTNGLLEYYGGVVPTNLFIPTQSWTYTPTAHQCRHGFLHI